MLWLVKYAANLLPLTRIALLSSFIIQSPIETNKQLQFMNARPTTTTTSEETVNKFTNDMRQCTLFRYDAAFLAEIIKTLNETFTAEATQLSYVGYSSNGTEGISEYDKTWEAVLSNLTTYGSFKSILLASYDTDETSVLLETAIRHHSNIDSILSMGRADGSGPTIQGLYALGFLKMSKTASPIIADTHKIGFAKYIPYLTPVTTTSP
jgi:hypothetical protein